MAVIRKHIVVVSGGTLPGQIYLIGVAVIAVDYGIVAVQLGGIGDAQGQVGIAGIDHPGSGINGFGGVDFSQTGLGHGDGHGRQR